MTRCHEPLDQWVTMWTLSHKEGLFLLLLVTATLPWNIVCFWYFVLLCDQRGKASHKLGISSPLRYWWGWWRWAVDSSWFVPGTCYVGLLEASTWTQSAGTSHSSPASWRRQFGPSSTVSHLCPREVAPAALGLCCPSPVQSYTTERSMINTAIRNDLLHVTARLNSPKGTPRMFVRLFDSPIDHSVYLLSWHLF